MSSVVSHSMWLCKPHGRKKGMRNCSKMEWNEGKSELFFPPFSLILWFHIFLFPSIWFPTLSRSLFGKERNNDTGGERKNIFWSWNLLGTQWFDSGFVDSIRLRLQTFIFFLSLPSHFHNSFHDPTDWCKWNIIQQSIICKTYPTNIGSRVVCNDNSLFSFTLRTWNVIEAIGWEKVFYNCLLLPYI